MSLAADKKSPLSDDEEIEASRAPLLDHLAELRNRLVTSLAAVVVGAVVCFFFANQIFLFLVEPFKVAMAAEQAEHHAAASDTIELINTGAFGFFSVKMQIALFGGIILAFPVIAWQAYAFIAPGLYISI